jgi:guanosine-3',5'-bis(diphosphate) 3'-pyrophosphohydrolase
VLTIDSLARRLESYMDADDIRLVKRAYFYADQAHDGQTRRSGEPYIHHPLAVANILADMHMDAQSLMAAMLHDVIEDTAIPKEALAEQFGDTVSQLVDGVSKLTHIKFETRAEQQAENFQKMALAMAKDIRVILVKLADRLHNMRTLDALPMAKKRRIAKETLDIYAPISNRLGISNIRMELEDLCFKATYPMRSALIQKAVKVARGHRSAVVEKIRDAVQHRLSEDGLKARIIGREKHLYSIYSKMKDRRKSFSDIMDVYGFRIIVNSVDECYRALGMVHNLYKPIPGRFKDYIAIPKANGYQSLHTTLIGMNAVPVEIQIRTEEMDAMAHNGIAAHWLYKRPYDTKVEGGHRTQQWVQGLLEMQKHAGNSQEFIESVKIDLFPDEIYVFTPKGKIFELPAGATAVDFAFAVHTDIGNACIGCRIDRRLAPLSSQLQSGQTVQIITAPGANPNPAWLSFVTTGKARSNIRHFLKNQRRSESNQLGLRLLEKSLTAFGHPYEDIPQNYWQSLLADLQLENQEALLEEIGLGSRMALPIARRLSIMMSERDDVQPVKPEKPLTIRGTEGMVVSFAKCCGPIPGDPIIGHVSSGRGLVVHLASCKNMQNIMDHPDKYLHLQWDNSISEDFPVSLRIELNNRRGVIAELASTLSIADGNVDQISLEDRDAHLSVVSVRVRVQSRNHLAHIIKRMRGLAGVQRVVRVKNA